MTGAEFPLLDEQQCQPENRGPALDGQQYPARTHELEARAILQLPLTWEGDPA